MSRSSPSLLAAAVVIAVATPALSQTPVPRGSDTAPTRSRAVTRAATANAQSVAQPTASRQISRARLQEALGGERSVRVVRESGVSDVSPAAAVVNLAPGEFLFRKLSDTARLTRARVGTTPLENPGVRPDVPNVQPVPPLPAPPPPPSRSTDATFAMPYRWMTVDAAGVERILVPYFVLLGGGLSYDVASRTYQGRALIGVEDTLNASADPVTLARPLRMVLATTRGGRISPAQIAIAHTSLDYDSVRIESPDSNIVHISTRADQAGIFIPIPVLGVSIAMTPQQRRLQGFGLSTTDIGVTLPRGMGRTDTAVVTFSSTGSPVHPNQVRVSGAEGATVRLRSGLPGPNTIRAFIDGVEVGQTEVVSETPISFLVATVLGILLGGAARFVGGKRRKRVRSLPWDVARGAPFGLLASIASAVGLDLAQLKLGEPGALPAIMVTAAIGAWLGAKVLDRGGASAPATARTSP
jgi:hypothetical protein